MINRDKLEGDYYKNLADNYLIMARAFVPKYDELVASIIDAITIFRPKKILDIGSGIGNLEALLIERMPEAKIVAVEKSLEMVEVSSKNIDNGKVLLINSDILNFNPTEKFDCIFSNMVLHNVDYQNKEILLGKIKSWLHDGGVFVWGDLIKHSISGVQDAAVNYRRNYGLNLGGPKDFADANFEKEEKYDFPYTIEETFSILRKLDFNNIDNFWTHDTFSAFVAK